MSSPPYTPLDAARALYAVLPRACPPERLEEYGISSTPGQAHQILRELLALGLFWAGAAVESVLPPRHAPSVMAELRTCIQNSLSAELGLDPTEAAGFFEEAERRGRRYQEIVRERGAPVAVATEAAAHLEEIGAIRPEDRHKALALIIDLTPVDELGDLVQEVDLD